MASPLAPAAPQAEVLVADIGSTITKLSAFAGLHRATGAAGQSPPIFLGQGVALTTVAAGDVLLGLETARQDLVTRHGVATAGAALLATSSAAGGLRMSVHGLTLEMTLRAAREASLGAGAIITLSTVGLISMEELEEMRRHPPQLILLAGGVDDGDQHSVMANAHVLASLGASIPVIYAGNRAARSAVQQILQEAHVPVFLTENVYPRLDELCIEPVRQVIQELFAKHIMTAPGMEKVKAMLSSDMLPTPAAVLRATELLADHLGDVLTIDVGGATTDVHSVTAGSPMYRQHQIAPEPRAKRTVEGDLGVYSNAPYVAAAAGMTQLDLQHLQPLPAHAAARQLARELTRWAVDLAVWRHAGIRRTVYGALAGYDVVEGRDLTAIRYIIGTGGALTQLGMGRELLTHLRQDPRQRKLLPPVTAKVLLDQHYIMAAAGVLSQDYPEAALTILLASLGWSAQADTL